MRLIHDNCPACQLEAETGERAPDAAHGWRAPTEAELSAMRPELAAILDELGCSELATRLREDSVSDEQMFVPPEVRQPMRGVLTDAGIERWWIRPHPELGGHTPAETWLGDRAAVLALIDGYLNPTFS